MSNTKLVKKISKALKEENTKLKNELEKIKLALKTYRESWITMTLCLYAVHHETYDDLIKKYENLSEEEQKIAIEELAVIIRNDTKEGEKADEGKNQEVG